MAPEPGRAGWVGVGLGVLAAGAAVGAVVERRVLGRTLQAAQESPSGFGSVHSPPIVVTADDGVELYAEVDEVVEGAEFSGPTLVFCHGYALNLDVWHYQRLALAGSCRAVYWDQRGHGRSGRGPAGPVTIERLAADLAGVLSKTTPTGPIVLVGHSMGGMTALGLAQLQPELFSARVAGVALLSTSAARMGEVTFGAPAVVAKAVRWMVPGVMNQLARAPRLIEFGRRTGNDLEFLLTRLYSFSSDVSPATVDFVSKLNASTPIDVVADFFGAFAAHDATDALPHLRKIPTLIMVGEDDKLTPAEHSRAMFEALPEAELDVLADCGHMILLEYPDEVTTRLHALLVRATARLS